MNLFPEWAIENQDEALLFLTVVNYNINSSHFLKVHYVPTVYTIFQDKEVRAMILYSSDKETEAQLWLVTSPKSPGWY